MSVRTFKVKCGVGELCPYEYLHELGCGVEHAGSMLLPLVLKGYYDEADRFRDGQDKGQDPDGHNFNGGNQGDPNPLNTTPGGHCSVPEEEGEKENKTEEGRKRKVG